MLVKERAYRLALASLAMVENAWWTCVSLARMAIEQPFRRCRVPKAPAATLRRPWFGPVAPEALGPLRAADDVLLVSVNDFYRAPSFKELRPRLHVIADPVYWDQRAFGEYGAPLIEALGSAGWEITLMLPARARHSHLYAKIREHALPHAFFRSTPVKGFAAFESLAFWRRRGMPKAQNVLVPAIAIALWTECTEIALVGADHSWHQELALSADNVVSIRQKHSYDGGVELRPFYTPLGVAHLLEGRARVASDTYTMREIFAAWSLVYESYEKLAEIARRARIKLVNCSTVTFVDAFYRQPLEDFLQDPPVARLGDG